MKEASSKQKQKDMVRNAIITAAEHTVLSEGWQAVSIRKIADAIGYSLPVVYNHFESKEAIQEEFVKRGFKMLAKTVANVDVEDKEKQLLEVALNYFGFALKNVAYYKLMFGLGLPSCQKANEIEEIKNFTQIVITALKKLIVTDNEEHIFLKFHCFWSILHGLTAISMVNMTAAPGELQQKILVDAVQGFIKNINN